MSSSGDIPGMSAIVDMLLRTPKDLGALIRQRRRDLGLDQGTLAERVGVSRQWIIEAERGKPRAEIGLVLRTLDALGVRLAVDDSKSAPAARAQDIDAIVRAARKPRG
jgi:HTH-type transcriptional regulator / antitoxin HipB